MWGRTEDGAWGRLGDSGGGVIDIGYPAPVSPVGGIEEGVGGPGSL